ncbi:SLC35E1 (predicted) [Pycnogonum litorale]
MVAQRENDPDVTTRKEVLRIVFCCIIWYFISSSNNVITKTILNDFQYPMTLSLVQFFSITVYSGPIFAILNIRPLISMSTKYYAYIILPLSLGKIFASVTAHFSLWKVSVSYSHTVKATLPLFTVILSRIILKESQTFKVYCSLAPIIVGVVIATATELSFNMVGLLCAILATLGFSLQNIFSKKVLHETGVHHMRLLHLLAKLALIVTIPLWLMFDFRKIMHDETLAKNTDITSLLFLLFLDGFLNFAQNIVAFTMISLVTPLTYSVCSSSKRIVIITTSIIIIRNKVSAYNVLGMVVAISGVFMYNKAKYDANCEKKRKAVLPYTKSDSNLLHKYELSNHVPYINLAVPADRTEINGVNDPIDYNYTSHPKKFNQFNPSSYREY